MSLRDDLFYLTFYIFYSLFTSLIANFLYQRNIEYISTNVNFLSFFKSHFKQQL